MRQDGTTVVNQVPVSSLHTVDVEGIKTTLKLFKTVWIHVVRDLKMLIIIVCVMSDSKCPAGVKHVYCFNDLCQVSHCPNYPEAKCVTRSCGKCTAHYYDTSGVDITALCGKSWLTIVYISFV